MKSFYLELYEVFDKIRKNKTLRKYLWKDRAHMIENGRLLRDILENRKFDFFLIVTKNKRY